MPKATNSGDLQRHPLREKRVFRSSQWPPMIARYHHEEKLDKTKHTHHWMTSSNETTTPGARLGGLRQGILDPADRMSTHWGVCMCTYVYKCRNLMISIHINIYAYKKHT